jgi:replicative DNA helicase
MDLSTLSIPSDIEAEMAVLGALMLDSKCWSSVTDLIGERDFYREANAIIWSHMQEIIEGGDALDIVSLNSSLIAKSQLENVGGIAYLMQIGDFTPTTSHVVTYAKLIRKSAARRRLIEQSFKLMQMIGDDIPTEKLRDEWISGVGDISESNDDCPHIEDVIGAEVDDILNRSVTKMAGISSGFTQIDDITNGFKAGEFIILGARPSMGKSALAIQMAINAARDNNPSVYVSIEMSTQMVAQRILGLMTGIDGKRIANNVLYEEEKHKIRQARANLFNMPLSIISTTPIDIGAIKSKIMRLKRERGLRVAFIDYLQMIDTNTRSDNRTREIGIISRALKSLAKETGVAIVALSSLSRAVEKRDDKRPLMSDLRESGDIESDADLIMFLYRPMYYAPADMREDRVAEDAELIVSKNRNGSVGTGRLSFSPWLAKFEDTSGDMF